MKRIALVVLLAALAMPALMVAQGPPMGDRPRGFGGPGGGPGMHVPMAFWRNSDVVKQLGLTDQQVKQIEQNFTENRLKLIDLRSALEKEQLKLDTLMNADQLNEQQISSQLDAVIAARGRLEKANAMMGVQMRKSLTPEQWSKLRQLRKERGDRWREERGERRRDNMQRRGAPDGPNGPGDTGRPINPPPGGEE